jgi:hypothetical protein
MKVSYTIQEKILYMNEAINHLNDKGELKSLPSLNKLIKIESYGSLLAQFRLICNKIMYKYAHKGFTGISPEAMLYIRLTYPQDIQKCPINAFSDESINYDISSFNFYFKEDTQ